MGFALADGGPARALALVPWADMLNHSPTAGAAATLAFDARSDTAQLKAHRSYAAHEQVNPRHSRRGKGRLSGVIIQSEFANGWAWSG